MWDPGDVWRPSVWDPGDVWRPSVWDRPMAGPNRPTSPAKKLRLAERSD